MFRKETWISLVLMLLMIMLPAGAMAADMGRVLENRPVTDGLFFEKRAVAAGGGEALVYILKADLKNPYLKINTMVGADGTLNKNDQVLDMAVNNGAVAAINADYFQMGESGRPIGITYRDGRMITSPPLINYMSAWGITKDGVPLIGLFQFTGKVTAANGASFPLSGVNKPSYLIDGVNSHENALLMYNSLWGKTSRGRIGDEDVVEVVVDGGVVTGIFYNEEGKSIPPGGFVLAGRGQAAEFIKTNIKVGDIIVPEYKVTPGGNSIWAGTGGWSMLVHEGSIMSDFPTSIGGSVARTAIGYSQDKGTLYLVCVEKSSASAGFTLPELASFMAGLGAYDALNLDGGGSTTIVVRPLGETSPVLVNKPQNGVQRYLPTAVGIFSTAPQGKLAGLVLRGKDTVLPGDSISFTVSGYDSHYNPYTVDPQKVKWSVESGPGTMEGNVFTGGEGGTAMISAFCEGVRGTARVRVLGSGDFSRIVVNPPEIEVEPGKTVDVSISAIGNDGTVYHLSPKNYSCTLDSGLGTYADGRFTAAQSPSAGTMKIVFDGKVLEVPVRVRSGAQTVYTHVPGAAGELNLKGFKVSFPGDAFGGETTVNASVEENPPGPVPERYTAVSMVRLEGGTDSLNGPAAVEWVFSAGEAERMAVLQFSGRGWEKVPSVVNGDKISFKISKLGTLALVKDKQPATVFKDMTGHWAAGAVSRLSAAGVVSGYPGNIFDPARNVTRAEFAVMLCKAVGWDPGQGEMTFKDKGDIPSWAAGYVSTAGKKGVLNGYNDGTFRPSRQVTRAEMAAMIAKALSLKPDESAEVNEAFIDSKDIPAWAEGAVSAVYGKGLMKGDDRLRFRAGDRATRAEAAALIDNTVKYMVNGPAS
ncbi:MAG: S-layer homology domain-containing protein [Bacillota bacterium]